MNDKIIYGCRKPTTKQERETSCLAVGCKLCRYFDSRYGKSLITKNIKLAGKRINSLDIESSK